MRNTTMKNMVNIEKIAGEIGVKEMFLDAFLRDEEMFSTASRIDGTTYVSIEEAYNFIVAIHFGRELTRCAMHGCNKDIVFDDDVLDELYDL